jgi:hypothetical protein
MRRFVAAFTLLLVAAPVLAQEPAPPGPSGPAEVMERAREARDAPTLPADHPPLPPGRAEVPVTEESVRLALAGAEMARAEADASVPSGSISVRVVDSHGAPLPNERVRLGIMRAEGGRSELAASTDAQGVALFTGLSTGNEQSYRPSVEAEGARVAANPFRLEPDRGQRVELRRLPVTRDPRYLLQALASTQLEFRQPGRVRVTQGARLLNPTAHVYVFPEGGAAVRLPDGAIAFQSRATMGDQRVVPTDEGFRIEGSVPPGHHELVWAYDLPLRGETFELVMPMAFKTTMGHRVVVDQVEGMKVEVEGMPDAFAHTLSGKRHLIVERRMRATDPPLETLRVRLTNIPTEGSLRSWAVWISIVLVLLGVASLLTARRQPARSSPLREAEMTRLVDDIRVLDRERAAGAIGPEYHQRAREEKVAELAELIDGSV